MVSPAMSLQLGVVLGICAYTTQVGANSGGRSLLSTKVSVRSSRQQLTTLFAASTVASSSSKVDKSDLVGEYSRQLSFVEKLVDVTKPSAKEELKLLLSADVSRADNFYETTFPKLKKRRLAAMEEKDTTKRIAIDENFINLMNAGYKRRLYSTQEGDVGQLLRPELAIIRNAAKRTENVLELSKSKEEQLEDLKRKKLMERSGVMRMVPQPLQKFIDYFQSMYKPPATGDLRRNLGLAAFFSFVVWANQSARSAFMYLVIGNLIMVSALLTRGMPKFKVVPGMPKKQNASWSSNSFKTAVAITLASSLTTAGLTAGLFSLFKLSVDVVGKAAMIVSLMCSSYATSFFEVFEEKSKNGWRWRSSLEGTLPSDVEARLAEQVFNSNKEMIDLYDFEYNPQVDDYPPLPKFVDDLKDTKGGSAETDEDDAKAHFEKWKLMRKEARRPPIEEAAPEEPWVGSKVGMYVNKDKIPSWLSTAYYKNVQKANKWRDKKAIYHKDTSEFEPIMGPVGFRDKRPEWLDLFGTGVWEEQTTASRRAARAFGSYRKTMWKIDKKVVLQKCDGSMPEPDDKQKKSTK